MKMKRFWGVLLSLALVLGLFPGMSLTAYAAPTETLLTTITGTGSNTNPATSANVSYSTEGVATLTFSGSVTYQATPAWGWWGYGWKATVAPVEGYTITKCVFYDDANRTATDSSSPFVVETTEEDKTPKVNGAVINYSSKGITKIDVYGYATPTHTHSFSYSADGATITATCSNTDGKCTLDDGTEQHNHAVTLTLSAIDAAYTGSAYTGASLSDTTAWTGAGLTAPTIEYAGRGTTSYTKSTTAPTAAGTYTASITVDTNKTATADFTISPMALTITGATATNRTYEKDNTAVTISAVTFKDSSSGSVTLTKDTDYTVTGAMTDANAGNGKTVNVTVTLKNANYSLATNTTTTTVNIGKAGAQTIADVTDTLLYTATSVSESVAGKMPSDAGTVTYAKAGDASKTGSVTVSDFAVDPTSGAVTATLSGGTAGDTITLPVTVSSTNYADSAVNVKITLTAKGTQTITADDVIATYGDTDKKVNASVTDPATGGGTISYAVKEGSADYIDVNASTGALTIKKVPPTDGKAFVTVTAAETDTYAQATKEVTVTISPKAMTVSASGYTGDYDEQPHGITVAVTDPTSGFTVKYGTEEGTYNLDSSPTQTEVGSKTVYYQVTAENYTPNTGSATVTINPKGSSGTPGEKTLVYNGTAQELVTAGVAEGGTMQYALGTDDKTAPVEGWSEVVPTGTDAGIYYVWYMVKGDENHNDTKPACIIVTIAKKGLTVTADAKSKTQGEADPALTYTVEGLVAGDTLTGALSREAGEDPGTYAITLGTLTAGDNYEITFISAVLTISKKDEPAPVPGGGSSSGGGGYYGGGAVQSQRRDAYSDVIGAAATNFWGSSPERVRNIELACEKLDGIVLQPGEVFSFNEAVGLRTAEAGFEVAPVDANDEATAEMGGGVGQVSSTLYASALLGLLEPVERTNHSFPVSFIQPGTDALVTNPDDGGNAADLKFRNTRSEPIRISATCRVDEATQLREVLIEIRSALTASDYMPILFDNSWGGNRNGSIPVGAIDYTRPGYRILLTHEEQAFTDDRGAGIRTLTHRKILDAAGMLVMDEVLNQRLSGDSYAMDTYYTRG